MTTDANTSTGAKQTKVTLRINPASDVDEYGTPPILVAGKSTSFTKAEADQLLLVMNPHGVPIFQRVKG